MAAAPLSLAQQKKKYETYVVNVKAPLDAQLFDTAAYVAFLQANFKPTKGGKKGNVGAFDSTADKATNALAFSKSVIISPSAEGQRVLIHTRTPLSKKYIKYMTNKYLKKSDLRDFLRLVSTTKRSYKVVFRSVKGDEEEAAEEEAAAEETVE